MFRNYLKTALRSLLRHRTFSAINIFGLAVATSICMGIIMLVADQMSYDRYNTKRDRIFQVTTVGADSQDGAGEPNSSSTMKLKDELLERYTGVEQVVRFKKGFGNSWFEYENQNVNIPLTGFFADPEVFEFFEYELEYGDPATALKEPFSLVLTRKASDKLFKDKNPIGKTMSFGELGTYTITGVLKATNKKTHIVFESLASMASVKGILRERDYRNEMDSWTNFTNGWTYILLKPGKSTRDIQLYLDKIYQDHIAVITDPTVFKKRFDLQGLVDITPGPMMDDMIGPVFPWLFVYFLGGLALVILLTSCFNFTNLSIARSLTRAREIGVRKVTGAVRWQIFMQFIVESVLVAFLALFLAMGIMLIVKPMILQLNFARMFYWDLQADYIVYGIFVLFAVVVGILAGLFPAVIMSGFQPIKVLKNLNTMRVLSKTGMRTVLMVVQFTFSLFFILTLILINNQLTQFVNHDHGFNMRHNILVRLNNTSHEALKTELVKFGDIVSVSAASHLPAAGGLRKQGFKQKLEDAEWKDLAYFLVDESYQDNMKIKLVAGNFFKAENGESNRNFIVINQQAVKKFQFNSELDAINQEVVLQHDSSRRTIIGVVKDYNHQDLYDAIKPMVLIYAGENFSLVQVAYSGTYENAVESIEKAWETVNPGIKIDLKEVDSEINQAYEIFFGDLVKILSFISILAIVISCMGLLGMATYATETRMKEISIRKVLGSSSVALVLLLSRGFLKMIAVAIALGVPAAYFINGLWLDQIAYHTSLDIKAIGTGVLTLILFCALTIGSQTIRATLIKPINNLKGE